VGARVQRVRDWLSLHPRSRVALYVLAGLVLVGTILNFALDHPARGFVERRMNKKLKGYTAKVGNADFQMAGLALVLENVTVVQDAHPEPPVLMLPYVRLSVHWRDIVFGRVVADATLRRPELRANLPQLAEEYKDSVPFGDHGWQRAVQAVYPLKINVLQIEDAKVVYQDVEDSQPLELTHLQVEARNIRNVRSGDRNYPSTFKASAQVFQFGEAQVEGRADFLAEPIPAVTGRLDARRVELSYFTTLAQKLGLTVKDGFLSASGAVEWAPKIHSVDLASIEIEGASAEYASGAGPTPQAKAAAARVTEVAKASVNNPVVRYRIRRILVTDSTLKVVNKQQDPPYSLDFTKSNLTIENLSSRAEDGPAHAVLTGAFMGEGALNAEATFYPEGVHANVAAKVAIDHTPLAAMNDLLRARGKFDVAQGTFELYSEVRIRDGAVEGYVKPLFKGVEVYESEQDKHKNVFKKMYEGIVGGAAKMLENKHGEIATVTSLNGPLEDPNANSLQALRGLLRNAFVKAIMPGFRNQIFQKEPYKYRMAMKKEKKETAVR
jgi:hypothetical protein